MRLTVAIALWALLLAAVCLAFGVALVDALRQLRDEWRAHRGHPRPPRYVSERHR